MRKSLTLVGIGFIVLLIGTWYAFGHMKTSPVVPDTMRDTRDVMVGTMKLTSSEFGEGATIPSQFTCDGANASPSLSISGTPKEAKSLVLIMDDPDVPKQLKPDGVFDHWVMFNIPPSTAEMAAGRSAGVAGANGAGKNSYTGPCPPSQYEPSEHRYFFRAYALDIELPLRAGVTKKQVQDAMSGHIIGQAELMGKYKRK